jgi:hypothetical protein
MRRRKKERKLEREREGGRNRERDLRRAQSKDEGGLDPTTLSRPSTRQTHILAENPFHKVRRHNQPVWVSICFLGLERETRKTRETRKKGETKIRRKQRKVETASIGVQ